MENCQEKLGAAKYSGCQAPPCLALGHYHRPLCTL